MVHKLTKRKHRSMPSCVWLHKSTQIEKKSQHEWVTLPALSSSFWDSFEAPTAADAQGKVQQGQDPHEDRGSSKRNGGRSSSGWLRVAARRARLQAERPASGCCGRAASFRLPALLPGYVGAPPGHPQGRALPSNPQGFRASTSVAAAPTAPSLRGANEGGCRLVDASGADGEGDRRDLEIGRGEPGG